MNQTDNITIDEEKKSLLKRLSEWLKEWKEKRKERHAPSVYEAVKKCEEALEEIGEAQNVNVEVLRNLVDITSDLESRMQSLTPDSADEMELYLKTLVNNFEDVRKTAHESVVKVTNDDISEAIHDCFCGMTAESKRELNGKKEILISPDNEIYIKTVNGYYAEVFFMKTDNEVDEVFISRANLSDEKIGKLIPAEEKEGDTAEDTILRAICKANDLIYKEDILKKTELEKRINSGKVLLNVAKAPDIPHQSTDGKTECIFMKSDNSFRIRDKTTNDMLIFTQNNGVLEVSVCHNAVNFNSESGKSLLGKWKSVENGGVKGKITLIGNENAEALLQSEFSEAYLTYVAGLSGERLKSAFEKKEDKITSKVSDEGMNKAEKMYSQICDLVNGKEGYSIQKYSHKKDNTVSLSIRVPQSAGEYYLNLTKDGGVKSHVFKPDDPNRKSETVLTGNNVVVNPKIAQEKTFNEYLSIVKQADKEISAEKKSPEKPDKQKGIEKE